MCRLEGDEDLDDFRVEIDILADCKHPNVVSLYDAFCIDSKLWVGFWFTLLRAWRISKFKYFNEIVWSINKNWGLVFETVVARVL
jgi:hypothetical protein